jgi:hypothetical protein
MRAYLSKHVCYQTNYNNKLENRTDVFNFKSSHLKGILFKKIKRIKFNITVKKN